MGATVYELLGIPPATVVHDRLNRPVTLCGGTPIEALFSGAAT